MSIQYRPDIDGLRAAAILSVIAYHAELGLRGGFTGVDVFFVISGYLITSILFADFEENGRVSFKRFYARRVARIAPSLFLVVMTVMAVGALTLSTSTFEVHALAKSGVAAILFSSNLYFLSIANDYFSVGIEASPLLHTWSLGIEEQYYIVWPILLSILGKIVGPQRSRQAFILTIGVLLTGSFVYCAVVAQSAPSIAFYSPLSRIWELGIGSLIALLPRQRVDRRTATAVSALGLMLIVTGFLIARPGPYFPFPGALLPTVGTALVIFGNGYSQRSPISRALSARVPVALGKVSYAWYLWHWPFLAFGHILNAGPPTPLARLAVVAASLIVAFATVAIYEQPLRDFARRLSSERVVAFGALAGIIALVATSGIYAMAKLHILPEDPRIAAAFNDRPAKSVQCLLGDSPIVRIPLKCLAKGRRPKIVLWGDSHADQWAPALENWANKHGWQVEQLTLAACPPLIGLTPAATGGGPYNTCRNFNRAVWKRIEVNTTSSVVVLAANWAPRVAGAENLEGNRGIPFFDYRSVSSAQSAAAMRRGLVSTLDGLAERRIPVVVLLQTPVPGRMAAVCVVRVGAEKCALSKALLDRQISTVDSIITEVLRNRDGVRMLDPTAVLCGPKGCPAEIEGHIAYYDAEHVSRSAAISSKSMAAWDDALFSATNNSPAKR